LSSTPDTEIETGEGDAVIPSGPPGTVVTTPPTTADGTPITSPLSAGGAATATTATDNKNDNGLVKGNCSYQGTALSLSIQIRPYRTGDDRAFYLSLNVNSTPSVIPLGSEP
jgi:hypothetical protein